jgi:SAM-dependent methyltransferase
MQTETPKQCGICGRESRLSFEEYFREYQLFECGSCHGEFWFPMRNPGAAWYEKDERYAARNQDPLKKPERNHREFLRDMPARGGKVLDVGMGTGNFLAAAEARGYRGYGIDFDRDAIESAKRTFGLGEVFPLDIHGALGRWGRGFFEAVTMFEVLEHLENPREYLGEVRNLLVSQGYLAVSVPYRGCPDFLKPNDKPPRHLTRWSKRSLTQFLREQGFEVVRAQVIPTSIPYLVTKFHFWTRRFTSIGLVSKVARGGESSSSLKRAVGLTKAVARIKDYVCFGIPALMLYAWLWFTGKHGLGLYVLARKKDSTRV